MIFRSWLALASHAPGRNTTSLTCRYVPPTVAVVHRSLVKQHHSAVLPCGGQQMAVWTGRDRKNGTSVPLYTCRDSLPMISPKRVSRLRAWRRLRESVHPVGASAGGPSSLWYSPRPEPGAPHGSAATRTGAAYVPGHGWQPVGVATRQTRRRQLPAEPQGRVLPTDNPTAWLLLPVPQLAHALRQLASAPPRASTSIVQFALSGLCLDLGSLTLHRLVSAALQPACGAASSSRCRASSSRWSWA